MNKWTPCSEELPEVSGWYLTTTMFANKPEGCVSSRYFHAAPDIRWGKHDIARVVAWMELPEPYHETPMLRPCPFCGGEAKIMDMDYPHWVYCEDCGAKVHGGTFDENDSIIAWNRRAKNE